MIKSKGRIEVVDSGLIRGYRPKGFQALKDIGCNTVVNLQYGWFELFTDSSYEKEKAEDFGMIEKNYHLSDFSAPRPEKLEEIVGYIEQQIIEGKTVYVHCKWGKDRTGMVCAAYRMLVQGWLYRDAVNEMLSFGFHTIPYKFWVKNLKALK